MSEPRNSEPGAAGPAASLPHWASRHPEETRWAPFAAVVIAAVLQLALPQRLSLGPGWLLPSAEGGLALGLLIANPFRRGRDSPIIRRVSLLLVAVVSVANGASAALLIRDLLQGRLPGGATALLANGSAVYITNVIAFALWYWEVDRGGPIARAAGGRLHPDFLFPQMTSPRLAKPHWQPTFVDYLYVSFTNATAFSPTDTMPLSRGAKMLMLAQSLIALITVALVIARAVNIFR